MARIYDGTDFFWSWRGDYAIDADGDIASTEYDPLRAVVQDIRDILSTNAGDWKLYFNRGASLSDFVGELNSKITAENIKTRIVGALTKTGTVSFSDIKVKYIPIDNDKLMIRINLSVTSTAENFGSENLKVDFVYSYSENNVFRADN